MNGRKTSIWEENRRRKPVSLWNDPEWPRFFLQRGRKLKIRIKAAILAAALCVCLCTVSVHGADGTRLVLSYPETLPPAGGTFTVTVAVTGNPGLCAVQFTLKSRSSAVECVTAKIGGVLNGALAAANPSAPDGAIVAAASSEALTGDGSLGVFTYRVLAPGDAGFRLDDIVLTGADGKAVPYTTETSALTASTDTSTGSTDTSTGSTDTSTGSIGAGTGSAQTFADVSESHWAYGYIQSAVKEGLFTGFPDDTFRPDENVTRAQFITVLWRAAGKPAPAVPAVFTDLGSETAYYRDAVSWGYEKGYLNGSKTSNGTYYFDPNGAITRQQAAAVLFRCSGSESGAEQLLTGIYQKQFTDGNEIASYAEDAVWWAVYHGYLGGTTPTALTPGGNATRAQVAKILTNYLDDRKE